MQNSCFLHRYFCFWYCRKKYEIGSCLIFVSLSFLFGEVIAHSENVLCCSVEASLPSQTWNGFCSHHWRCLGCPSTPPLVMSESRMFASAGLFPVSGAGKGWASARPPKSLGSAKQLTASCSTCIGQLRLGCRSVLCVECLELKLSDNSVNITIRNAQEVLHPVRKKGNLVQQDHSYHVFLICTSLDPSWPKVLNRCMYEDLVSCCNFREQLALEKSAFL